MRFRVYLLLVSIFFHSEQSVIFISGIYKFIFELFSAKFEYEGRKLPQFRQICEVADLEPMPNELLLSFELSILKNVEWDLCTPNVSTFLEFFGQYSISSDDKKEWIRMKNNVLYLPFVKNNSLAMHMNKKLNSFLSITLLGTLMYYFI